MEGCESGLLSAGDRATVWGNTLTSFTGPAELTLRGRVGVFTLVLFCGKASTGPGFGKATTVTGFVRNLCVRAGGGLGSFVEAMYWASTGLSCGTALRLDLYELPIELALFKDKLLALLRCDALLPAATPAPGCDCFSFKELSLLFVCSEEEGAELCCCR